MSDEPNKRPLSAAELEQRREAAKKPKTMTPAALEQRREAAQHSTGPITPEGKAICSRNNWKTGEYSAITKADTWQRLVLMTSKPCHSTADCYPCSLVETGEVAAGQDCKDKRIFMEAFEAVIATLQSGDARYSHGILAAQVSGAIEVLDKLRAAVAKEPISFKPLVNKAGEVVGEMPMANPVLSHYILLLDKLGINLPELMATPRAVAKQKADEDATDVMAEMFGDLMRAASRMRRGRTIEGEAE